MEIGGILFYDLRFYCFSLAYKMIHLHKSQLLKQSCDMSERIPTEFNIQALIKISFN